MVLQACLELILLGNGYLVVSDNDFYDRSRFSILMSFTWNQNKRLGAKKFLKTKVELAKLGWAV